MKVKTESGGRAENDHDSLVTKIKTKLLSGRIWNKVVRLSRASGFSVETTSAIAGVRGTELFYNPNGPISYQSPESFWMYTI